MKEQNPLEGNQGGKIDEPRPEEAPPGEPLSTGEMEASLEHLINSLTDVPTDLDSLATSLEEEEETHPSE